MRVAPLLLAALAACATTEAPRRATRRRRPRPAAAAAATTSPSGAPAPRHFDNPAPAAPAATQPSPRAAPRVAADDPRCREVLARSEAVLARVASHEPCAGAAVTALRASFHRCASAARGTWAPELVDADARRDDGVCELDVRWRVTLLHPGGEVDDGEAGRVARSFTVLAGFDEAQSYAELEFTASDLDGDALPELVVTEQRRDHAGDVRHAMEVYTGREGRVRVYGPTRAMRLVGVTDLDDDGRADLVVPAPYAWTEGSECGAEVIHEPLTMLAHTLPGGGFSTDDAVAARYLRGVCPSPDAEPDVAAREPAVREGVAVVCRRLWGLDPDAALAPQRCARFRPAPSPRCSNTTRALPPLDEGECPAHWSAWAHAEPPLRLR